MFPNSLSTPSATTASPAAHYALLAALVCPPAGIHIVDPDCGDGRLLAAMGVASRYDAIREAGLFGMATDAAAWLATTAELARHGLQYTRVEQREPGRFAHLKTESGLPILADWLVTARLPSTGMDEFICDALAASKPHTGQMALVLSGGMHGSAGGGALCAGLAQRNLIDALIDLPGGDGTASALNRLILVRQDRPTGQTGVICPSAPQALHPGTETHPWPAIVAAYRAWQGQTRHPLLAMVGQPTLRKLFAYGGVSAI